MAIAQIAQSTGFTWNEKKKCNWYLVRGSLLLLTFFVKQPSVLKNPEKSAIWESRTVFASNQLFLKFIRTEWIRSGAARWRKLSKKLIIVFEVNRATTHYTHFFSALFSHLKSSVMCPQNETRAREVGQYAGRCLYIPCCETKILTNRSKVAVFFQSR